ARCSNQKSRRSSKPKWNSSINSPPDRGPSSASSIRWPHRRNPTSDRGLTMIQIPDRSHHRAGKPERGARPLPHPLTPYEDLVVNFCPTGMIPTKSMTPHVPVSPSEVIDQACMALERGVAIVHLHAREDDGSPTYRGEIYEEMILGIRADFPDAIIYVR